MKHILQSLTVFLFIAHSSLAGESSLTKTYQPLTGLGSDSIYIAPVVCHDWYSHSGFPTHINLISAKNIPPTNNSKQATQNLNLASLHGIKFETSDHADPPETYKLTLDTTNIKDLKGNDDDEIRYREEVIRASLECLRRCLSEEYKNTAAVKFKDTPITLKCNKVDKDWLEKIVGEFNIHNRKKVFYDVKN